MDLTETRAAFVARLNDVCDEMGIPRERGRQTALGKRFGVTAKAARKWLVGEGYPELELAIRIANDAQVHVTWLLQGVGPKRITPSAASAAVGESIAELPVDDRQQVIDFLRYKFERADGWFAAEKLSRYMDMLDKFARSKPPTT